MKKLSLFVFALAIAGGSSVYALAPRDAGSKVRGEAQNGTGDAVTSRSNRNYARPAPQQYVRTVPQATQAPADATAATDSGVTGTRTMSVEPQTPARTQQTYRTYAPQRRGLLGWLFGN